MKKRLMIGLAVGALVAAMAPGVASAEPSVVKNTGQCVKAGVFERAAYYSVPWEPERINGPATNAKRANSPWLNSDGRSPFEGGTMCAVPHKS